MEKKKDLFMRIFYALFAVIFTFVIINVFRVNAYHKTSLLIAATIPCIAAITGIYLFMRKYENTLEKNYDKILIIFSIVMFLVQMTLGLILRHDSAWDIGAINKGAVEWVETGTFEGYYEYFCGCSNNLGPTAFYFIFFKMASLIGITDYYAVAVFVDSVMLTLLMTLASLICRKLTSSARCGVFALVLFAVSAQYWFMAAANYTDVMSMLFPILTYWLYLKSKEAEGKRRIILYLFAGLSAAVGSLIKFTVIIAVVAIIIYMLFNEKPRHIAEFTVSTIVITAIALVSFNSYIFSNHLSRDMAEGKHRPLVHWVMMGLKGDGRYNPADFEFTDNLPPEEREEKISEEIRNRVHDLGFSGMLGLTAKKSAIDFGDGTYGIADMLNFELAYETELKDWIIYGGDHYSIYSHYATAVHISIMILMLIAAYILALAKKEQEQRKSVLILYLAIFGVWLFLMCWETNRRYFSNFAPIIIICGVVGMEMLTRILSELITDAKSRRFKKTV